MFEEARISAGKSAENLRVSNRETLKFELFGAEREILVQMANSNGVPEKWRYQREKLSSDIRGKQSFIIDKLSNSSANSLSEELAAIFFFGSSLFGRFFSLVDGLYQGACCVSLDEQKEMDPKTSFDGCWHTNTAANEVTLGRLTLGATAAGKRVAQTEKASNK